jgi:hypothetical protein
MGLPVRQRRVLERIESALRGSDPKLAAIYAIFARLNRDEEMPRAEQLRHRALLVLARLRLIPLAIGARMHVRVVPRQRVVLFFPLAVALAVASIVFAARSSSGTCTPVKSVAATKTVAKAKTNTIAKTNLCRAPVMSGLYFGH